VPNADVKYVVAVTDALWWSGMRCDGDGCFVMVTDALWWSRMRCGGYGCIVIVTDAL